MSDENSNNPQEEEPQLFAVKKSDNGGWSFSRREFIKGAGATALSMRGIIGGVTNAEETPAPTPTSFDGARSHTYGVESLAINPSGTLLASGASFFDNTIKLWSLPDGTLLKTLEGHTDSVDSLAISPDGTLLASGSDDNTIKLWSLPDGALLKTLASNVTSVAISPDGTLLASGNNDNTIKLWSLPNGELFKTLEGHTSFITSVAISSDGMLLASGSGDETIKLWLLPPKQIQTVTRVIRNVRARTEPTTSGGDETVVKTLVVGELLLIQEGVEAVQADNYTWIPIILDGEDAWVAQEGFVELVEEFVIPQPEIIKTLTGHTGTVTSVAISPDGTLLASGSADDTIKLWSLPDGELLNTLEGHTRSIYSIAISPDGTLLASGSSDDSIRLWLLPDGMLINTLWRHKSYVNSIVISPDGTFLISGSDDKTIKLWSLPIGAYRKDLIDISVSPSSFEAVQYSPNDEGTSVITLPCGSDIPAGSTCICNCVAGGQCSCVGYSEGTDNHYNHYWYPN